MSKGAFRQIMSKIWHFIWEDDSVLSWIVNIILAFIIIKFIFYPGIGWMLGTPYPVVAVVSGSMEHDGNFEQWWQTSESWYAQKNITEQDFQKYKFKNGFNTGDIMVLKGKKVNDMNKGEVIVFMSQYKTEPIIHRVVEKYQENNDTFFNTKGDHNQGQGIYDMQISQDKILGTAFVRIPYLGWVKIGFVKLLQTLHIIA